MHTAPRIFSKTALALAVAIATPAVAQMQIEEVIVTAQKREQTLQDVPGSVAAISSELMEKTVTNNFEDLSKITSGIRIEGGADGFGKVIRIRGVGTNSFVPAIRPAVGIFLNDIPLGAPEMAYNNLADIERIEILKGPQATLFGKEVSSGAITMHTRRPSTEEVDGYVEANVGNLDLFEVRGGGNLPISDSMAMRISGYYNERGEIVDNITVRNRPGGEYEQTGIRAHFQWDFSDNLTAMLGYEHHETDVDGSVSVAQEYGDLYQTLDTANAAAGNSLLIVQDPYDRKTDNSDPSNRETDIDMVSLHVDWDINDTWSVNSITSYQDYEFETYGFNENRTSDTSVGPYYLSDFINKPSTESFTQELRLNYEADKLSSILGLFYADTDTESYTPFTTPVGIFAGGNFRITAAGLSDLDEDIEEWAIFSHNIYSFTEELDLTFGIRYSYVDKESVKGQTTGNGPLADLNSDFVPVTPWADDIPVQDDDWDEVLGTVKLTYWLNENVSVYGGWDRGFKAGGHNVCKDRDGEPFCPEPFDSETADSFEVGMKGRFFDRTLSWNLSAFYQTYDDYQVEIADEIGIGNSVQNAAEVEISGIESDFVWLATENLTIDGNISYIDAEWDDYKDAGCIRAQYQREACSPVTDENGNTAFVQDLSGEDLNYSPELTYNLNMTWSDTFAGGWDWYIRGEVAYRDEVYFFPDLDPDLVGDDYTLLNASFGVTAPSGNWDIVVWGKNLDDEEYLSGGSRNRDATQPSINPVTNFEGYRVTAGLERTYGVTARYRF
jgi:iron complex outermembrane receptor protein